MVSLMLHLVGVLLPLLLSLAAALNDSVFFLAAAVVLPFLLVAILPGTRGYENLWMFLLVGLSAIPVNIRLISLAMRAFSLESELLLITLSRAVLLFVMAFCAEELVFALATRLLWPRQRKLRLNNTGG